MSDTESELDLSIDQNDQQIDLSEDENPQDEEETEERPFTPDSPEEAYGSSSEDEGNFPSSSSSLPLNPNILSFSLLSVPTTTRGITFEKRNFEGSTWKFEFQEVMKKLNEKILHSTGDSSSIPRSKLIKALYERIAHLLISPEFGIFQGVSSDEKLSEFGAFMATLHILKVVGLSFAEMSDPSFSNITRALNLPLSLKRFEEIIDAIDRPSSFNLLKKAEKVFTLSNSNLFYHPSFELGIDDDKMPTRSEELKDLGIKRVGGRDTRTYPVADELNTIAGFFTIGRNTQNFDSNTKASSSRLIKLIMNTSEMQLPNLVYLDRGYDASTELFDKWFGTLKRTLKNVFCEVNPSRPKKYSNMIELTSEGCQAYYVARIIPSTSNPYPVEHFQTAFCANGSVTYLSQPDVPSWFGRELVGLWYGIPTTGNNLRSPFELCPLRFLKPGSKIYTSGQEKDACWHLARAGILSSRSAYNLINVATRLRLPFLQPYKTLLRMLGWVSFAPYPECELTEEDVDRLKPKDFLIATMKSYGCPVKKKLVGELKEDFKAFIASRERTEVTPEEVTYHLLPILLSSMFMKPFADDKIKAFRLGLENEPKVLSELPTLFQREYPGSQISPVYRLGLSAAPEGQRVRMATSPDGIFLKDQRPVLCEIKTSTSPTTAGPLRRSIHDGDHVFRAIDILTLVEEVPVAEEDFDDHLSTTDRQFQDAIPFRQHRCQVLHHCSSLSIPEIVYVQSDLDFSRKYRYIRFSLEILETYRQLISEILNFIQFDAFVENLLVYPTTEESKSAAMKLDSLIKQSREAAYCRDAFSVAQQFALGKLLRDLPSTPPACYKIKPAIIDVWNGRKSHSDSASQYKQSVTGACHKGTRSYLLIRLLDSLTLNFLKVDRLLRCYPKINSAVSLQAFRKMMSRKPTLRGFLLETACSFLEAFGISRSPIMDSSIPSSSSQQPRIASTATQSDLSECIRSIQAICGVTGIGSFQVPQGSIYRELLLTSLPTRFKHLIELTSTLIPQEFPNYWILMREHLPMATQSSAHCNIPKCDGRTRYRCNVCKLFFCYRPQRNCWLHIHDVIFSHRLAEFFDTIRMLKDNKRNRQ